MFRPIIYVRGDAIHLAPRSTSGNYDIDWTEQSEITLSSLTQNVQIFDTMGEPRGEEDIQEVFFQTRSLTIKTGDAGTTVLRLYGYPNSLNMSNVTLTSPSVATVTKGATGIDGDKAYIDLTISWTQTGDDTLTATLGAMKAMTALHVERTAEAGKGTQFYDDYIVWYLASKAESENDEDLATFVSRDVLCVRHLDSKEPDNTKLQEGKVALAKALKKIGYSGALEIEYERDFTNNVQGMAESVGYFRGVMDSLR